MAPDGHSITDPLVTVDAMIVSSVDKVAPVKCPVTRSSGNLGVFYAWVALHTHFAPRLESLDWQRTEALGANLDRDPARSEPISVVLARDKHPI